jgi:hypothetical protein
MAERSLHWPCKVCSNARSKKVKGQAEVNGIIAFIFLLFISNCKRLLPGGSGTKITNKKKQTNFVALSPRANYTNWATATCRRNLVPTLWIEGCPVVSAADPLRSLISVRTKITQNTNTYITQNSTPCKDKPKTHKATKYKGHITPNKYNVKKKCCPYYRPWRPFDLWDVEDSKLFEKSIHSRHFSPLFCPPKASSEVFSVAHFC